VRVGDGLVVVTGEQELHQWMDASSHAASEAGVRVGFFDPRATAAIDAATAPTGATHRAVRPLFALTSTLATDASGAASTPCLAMPASGMHDAPGGTTLTVATASTTAAAANAANQLVVDLNLALQCWCQLVSGDPLVVPGSGEEADFDEVTTDAPIEALGATILDCLDDTVQLPAGRREDLATTDLETELRYNMRNVAALFLAPASSPCVAKLRRFGADEHSDSELDSEDDDAYVVISRESSPLVEGSEAGRVNAVVPVSTDVNAPDELTLESEELAADAADEVHLEADELLAAAAKFGLKVARVSPVWIPVQGSGTTAAAAAGGGFAAIAATGTSYDGAATADGAADNAPQFVTAVNVHDEFGEGIQRVITVVPWHAIARYAHEPNLRGRYALRIDDVAVFANVAVVEPFMQPEEARLQHVAWDRGQLYGYAAASSARRLAAEWLSPSSIRKATTVGSGAATRWLVSRRCSASGPPQCTTAPPPPRRAPCGSR
jgi:hypothetical protein